MKDTDFLIEQVEKALEECRKKHRTEEHLHGECDLCGAIGRIIEGLCHPCRDKYKLWEKE